MTRRLRTLGVILSLLGLGFLVSGGIAYSRVQAGYGSLQAFSEAQNVTLSYDDAGQLTDRGTTEGAQAILGLLTEDWAYPVNRADLDPSDPLVNTASEYMYQMATIAYHTLNGTQTVVLTDDAEYNGEVFPAGTYQFAVEGRYWTGFDRQHPIEGPAREQAWSGTAHALIAELGVGTATHTTLQIGLGIAAILAGLGLVALVTGLGVIWVAGARRDPAAAVLPDEPMLDLEEDDSSVFAEASL